ncbi:WS/DGAT/MGAT family O-acyltransferase [Gordonia sp. GN26]
MNPFGIYVFDGEKDLPSFGRIRTVLAQRASEIPLLGVKVVSPSPWIYPRWTVDPTGADEKIFELDSAPTWDRVLAWLQDHVDDDIDPHSRPWRLFVARHVSGVPGTVKPCAVVITQHSHALADGMAWSEVAASLFGSERTAIGPVATVDRVRKLDFVRELAGIPVDIVRACRPLIRLAKAGPGHVHNATNVITQPQAAFDRWIRVRPLRKDVFKVPGETVTTSAVWRAAVGIDRYRRRFGLDVSELSFEVPLSIRRSGEPNVSNALVLRQVDAALEKDDETKLALIGTTMAEARRFARGSEAQLTTQVADLLPARLVQRDVPPKASPVSVSSYVRRGPLELLGAQCLWSGGGVGRDNAALSVRAIGYGDTVAMSVSGNSHAIDHPDVLVDLMLGA